MQIKIQSMSQLGDIVRAVRKSQGIRQDDMGDIIETSHVYVKDVEKGSSKANIGGVMRLMDELGIQFIVDVPDDAVCAIRKGNKS